MQPASSQRQIIGEVLPLRTVIVAIVGLIFGILLLFSPYLFTGQPPSEPLWVTLASVLGAFILSAAVMTPIHSYFLWKYQLEQTQSVLEKSLAAVQDNISSSV